jgi:branched-subunit amino acid ABC-type transport system permease component
METYAKLSEVQQRQVVLEQMHEGLSHPLQSPYFLIGALGCALWSVAYVLFLRQGQREKTQTLPTLAICLNFTWELMAVIGLPHPNPIWYVLEWTWLILDVGLLGQLVWYLAKDPSGTGKPQPVLFVGALLLICLVGQVSFVRTFDDPLGFIVAFGINLVMSALFVQFYFQRQSDLRGLNYPAAWLKMIGTGCTSIQCAQLLPMLRPDIQSWAFLQFMYWAIFGLDAWYVALLWGARKRRESVP